MRMSWTGIALIAFAPLPLASCGDADSAAWDGTVRDSAGIAIVTSNADAGWNGQPAWTVHEDLVIGTAAGDPDYQFGMVAGLDVGDDGRIYVVDQQAQQVRVYDRDGTYVESFGDPGSGPGELSQGISQVFVTPGDTVLVPDMGQQRLTRYAPDGTVLTSTPLPMDQGIPVKWMETPAGGLVQQAMRMQLPGMGDIEPANHLLLRSWSGEVQDTLLELPASQSVSFSEGRPSVRLFEGEPVWSVGPEGNLYHGINSEYRITVHDPDGTPVRIIQRPIEPKAVTDTDQAEFLRVLMDAWRDQGMPAQAVEMMSQAVSFADHFPAFANFQGGPDGTLWVQEMQTPEAVTAGGATFDLQDIGGPSWDVFDADGRWLGTLRFPDRFAPLLFRGDAIYGVQRDDLDVQYVVRLTLDRGQALPG